MNPADDANGLPPHESDVRSSDPGTSLHERIAHSERMKRNALIELRETRLRMQVLQAEVTVLQQQAHGMRPAEMSPSHGAQEEHAACTTEDRVAETQDSPADESLSPQDVWAHLAAYHTRLTEWADALRASHSEVEQQQRDLDSRSKSMEVDRLALDRRRRAQDENRSALQRSLDKLASDRAKLEQEQAAWSLDSPAARRVLEDCRLEVQSHKRDVDILQGRLRQARDDEAQQRDRCELLRNEAIQLRIQLGAAIREASAQGERAEKAEEQVAEVQRKPGYWQVRASKAELVAKVSSAELDRRALLKIRSPDLLRDLVSHHSATLSEVIGDKVVTCGSGPWPVKELDEVLTAVGFEPHLLDDVACGLPVFVVGRQDVDVELLQSQLDKRYAAGEAFWLFSQELFVLSLLCGMDLLCALQAPKAYLVPEFAEDHPVLSQLLDGDDWQWPDAFIRTDEGGIEIDAGESPLASFGYHVGERSEPLRKRRELLLRFWESSDLAEHFRPEHNDEYRRRWGTARSGRRLTRIVQHIQWLQATQGRDDRKVKAAEDWAEDLKWIRRSLAPKAGARWRWPLVP